MEAPQYLVVCAIGDQRIGLPLVTVDRVVPAVAFTPLPGAPKCVPGVINLQGRIVPVIDLRSRYGLAPREMELSDEMVIADAVGRKVAILVDSAELVECGPRAMTPTSDVVSAVPWIHDIVKRREGLVLLHDVHLLLSADEQELLLKAMETQEVAHGTTS